MIPDEEGPLLTVLDGRFLTAKDSKTRRRFVFLSPTPSPTSSPTRFDDIPSSRA
jgi:hypothetical protein